jgi:hypothetical protein
MAAKCYNATCAIGYGVFIVQRDNAHGVVLRQIYRALHLGDRSHI